MKTTSSKSFRFEPAASPKQTAMDSITQGMATITPENSDESRFLLEGADGRARIYRMDFFVDKLTDLRVIM
jgi:hypothetical protein